MSQREEGPAHLGGRVPGHRRPSEAKELSPERLEHIEIFAALAAGGMLPPSEPPRGRRVAARTERDPAVDPATAPPVRGKRVRQVSARP